MLVDPGRGGEFWEALNLASGSSTEQEIKTNDAHSETSSLWHCPRCHASMIVIQRFTAAELSACIYFDTSYPAPQPRCKDVLPHADAFVSSP